MMGNGQEDSRHLGSRIDDLPWQQPLELPQAHIPVASLTFPDVVARVVTLMFLSVPTYSAMILNRGESITQRLLYKLLPMLLASASCALSIITLRLRNFLSGMEKK